MAMTSRSAKIATVPFISCSFYFYYVLFVFDLHHRYIFGYIHKPFANFFFHAAKIGIIFRTAKFYAAFWLPKKNLAGGIPGEVDVETGDFNQKTVPRDPRDNYWIVSEVAL